jgi:hypothetical protein
MKYIFSAVSIVLLGHLLFLSSCKEEPIDVPYISSFTPQTGTIGTLDTIRGANFGLTPEENLVNINGKTCTLLYASATELIIRVVPGISTGQVSVTVDRLSAVSNTDFILMEHRLDSIHPKTGAIGDQITFFVAHLPDPTEEFEPLRDITLIFNDIPSQISDYTTVNDSTKSFSAFVPADAVSGKVYVKMGAITAESKNDFEVIP